MLSRAGGNSVPTTARQFSQVMGGAEGSTVSHTTNYLICFIGILSYWKLHCY
jgi:hypothetical protein